jgi:hypothetical protein
MTPRSTHDNGRSTNIQLLEVQVLREVLKMTKSIRRKYQCMRLGTTCVNVGKYKYSVLEVRFSRKLQGKIMESSTKIKEVHAVTMRSVRS